MDSNKELEKIDKTLWELWLKKYVGGELETLKEFYEMMVYHHMYPAEAVDGFIKKYGAVRLLLTAQRCVATISAIAKEQIQ